MTIHTHKKLLQNVWHESMNSSYGIVSTLSGITKKEKQEYEKWTA